MICSMRYFMISIVFAGIVSGCVSSPGNADKFNASEAIANEQLLDTIQYRYFQYFWDGAEPNSGLARERFHEDDIYPQNDKHIVTTGGSGFGLMAILVGIERGFITREEGLDRLLQIIDFLEDADRF